MKNNKFTKSDYLLLIALVLIFGIFAANFSYTQNEQIPYPIAPEPGSIALISTGLFGWLIRFARKRFNEFKRCFDIAVGSFGLIFAAPVMFATGMAIRIASPGPVFFRQERVGLNGEIFNIYKLRTMVTDAEKQTGPVWAQEDDPRLIRLGRISLGKIIRKMHLDELPQLLNVLKGEMSIVGPRPERPVFVEQLSSEIVDYKKRLNVKPGITGLAQVVHKYDETIKDVKKKVKLDLLYIREMCLMVDIRILLRTIIVSVQGKGAR